MHLSVMSESSKKAFRIRKLLASYFFNIPGNVTSCGALYMYSPVDGSLKAIEITWTPIQVTS